MKFLSMILFLCSCTVTPQLKRYKSSPAEVMAQSKDTDWRSPKLENLIYLWLKSGLVIIELSPEFAPLHSQNIRAIVSSRYWDGLSVMRSQDNYVAQWGDADNKNDKILKKNSNSIKKRLPPEFERLLGADLPITSVDTQDVYAPSIGFHNGLPVGVNKKTNKAWLLHCYAMVGVSRDQDIHSGNGTSLYAVTGHSPRHLDRNITLVGKVIYGIEHLSTLTRGKGRLGFYENKKLRHPVVKAQMGPKVAKNKRLPIQVLRTDTRLFKSLIEARKNRKEKWFHQPAGHISVCNIPVPTRINK